jgi:hypothetical protein
VRWEDERYVRLYTRDTITWKMLPWEGKALLALLFRKVDRAGLIDVGDYGAEGVAALVDLPTDVVSEGLAALIKAKTVQWAEGGTVLLVPNFLTAQEAHQSDAQRKRDQRERVVAKAKLDAISPEMSHGVTESHETGQIVTTGHTESQPVTTGHSDPIRSEPSLTEKKETSARSPAAPLELVPVDRFTPDLLAAYALYPRKEGKSKAMKKLKRDITTPAQYERFVAAIRNYARHVAGREPDKIKQFDSFVSVWEDYADGLPFALGPAQPPLTVTTRPSRMTSEELIAKRNAFSKGVA